MLGFGNYSVGYSPTHTRMHIQNFEKWTCEDDASTIIANSDKEKSNAS